jgi:hypothetical protein
MKKLILMLFVLSFLSCKKESEPKYCWIFYDLLGNLMTGSDICNKTEQELLDCRDCGTFNGQTGIRLGDHIGFFYDRADLPRFCWERKKANEPSYSGNYCNMTEKFANNFLIREPGTVIRKK